MEVQRIRRPEGPQDWEDQRIVITDLYITKGLELEDLMRMMEVDHFFKATKKQYKTHFTKWGLRKNVSSSEYNAIIKKKREREEEGKDSAFRLRGTLVDDSKIVRYEKKTKTGDEHEIAEAESPENLSCFTPSPVASSPNAPSPDLPHFQSPNHLCSSVFSPSERTLRVPSPRLLSPGSPESPSQDVNLRFSEFVRALLKRGALRDHDLVKLNIHLRHFELKEAFEHVYMTCQRVEEFGSDLSNFSLQVKEMNFSLRPVSCIDKYADKRGMFSSIGRRASRYFDLPPYLHDTCIIYRNGIQVEPTTIDLDKIIRDVSQIGESIRDILASAGKCKLLTTVLCQIMTSFFEILSYLADKLVLYLEQEFVLCLEQELAVRLVQELVLCLEQELVEWFVQEHLLCLKHELLFCLEQKYNPRRRRSESCESIRSMVSFQSDPVVDWEELLYGYNR